MASSSVAASHVAAAAAWRCPRSTEPGARLALHPTDGIPHRLAMPDQPQARRCRHAWSVTSSGRGMTVTPGTPNSTSWLAPRSSAPATISLTLSPGQWIVLCRVGEESIKVVVGALFTQEHVDDDPAVVQQHPARCRCPLAADGPFAARCPQVLLDAVDDGIELPIRGCRHHDECLDDPQDVGNVEQGRIHGLDVVGCRGDGHAEGDAVGMGWHGGRPWVVGGSGVHGTGITLGSRGGLVDRRAGRSAAGRSAVQQVAADVVDDRFGHTVTDRPPRGDVRAHLRRRHVDQWRRRHRDALHQVVGRQVGTGPRHHDERGEVERPVDVVPVGRWDAASAPSRKVQSTSGSSSCNCASVSAV